VVTSTVAAEECVALNRHKSFDSFSSRRTTLGNLPIWRALPVRNRRMIGPWCFLDRYGPLTFTGEKPMDVAPHPHIGLQTVSCLLDGEVVHRDTLGCEAVVRAGGVNVMTSGRGIAHSEETPRANSGRLEGVQLWVALPEAERHRPPSFQNLDRVPAIELRGGQAHLFAGTMGEITSPAESFSDLIGLELDLRDDASLPLAAEREHGLFVLSGEASFEDQRLEPNTMYYLGCGRSELPIRTRARTRLLVIGGVPFDETILMWWNFVARTPEEIAEARQRWERGEFGEVRGYGGPPLTAPPLAKIARPNPAS
jgi:redox-sensitive bicupin YhaK (pirin superfamily)